MPINIACPQCRANYNVAETAIGKSVTCKSCGKAFVVSAGGATQTPRAPTAAGGTATATRPTAGPAKPAARSPVEQELARLGVDGLIKQSTDIFGPQVPLNAPDPLANHFAQVPFTPIDKLQSMSEEERERVLGPQNPYAAYKVNDANPSRVPGSNATQFATGETAPQDRKLCTWYNWLRIGQIAGVILPLLLIFTIVAGVMFSAFNDDFFFLGGIIYLALGMALLIVSILNIIALFKLVAMAWPDGFSDFFVKSIIPVYGLFLYFRLMNNVKGKLREAGAQVSFFSAKFPPPGSRSI